MNNHNFVFHIFKIQKKTVCVKPINSHLGFPDKNNAQLEARIAQLEAKPTVTVQVWEMINLSFRDMNAVFIFIATLRANAIQ